ncbi:hypothetical protein ABPG75_006386 [Micractinium tetrahymenae]
MPLLSRLLCCMAPPPPQRSGEEPASAAARPAVPTFQQAPVQPDSPPVKPRALPEQGVPVVSLHASASAAPETSKQVEAAAEEADVLQQQEQHEAPLAGGRPGEACGDTAAAMAADNLEVEGSEPDALRLLPSGEPPQAPTVSSAAPEQEGPAAEAHPSPAPERSAPAASPSKRAGRGPSPSSMGRKPGGAADASPPGSPMYHPAPRASLPPPPPSDLAAAMANLATPHPVDPIADLNVIRAAATHTREALVPQLETLVPLLLRTMRAPRLGTARAAICTFRDLLATEGLGEALCLYVADDSSPTSSAVLALMQKATGGDLNSKRIAADANACLCTLVESISPVVCIDMLQNYAVSPKMHARVQCKAAALIVAAAYRLAVTDLQAFDKDVMSKLLKIAEPLLGAGASCRQTAKKLAVVVHSSFSNQPHMHVALPSSPRKGGRTSPAQSEGASSGAPSPAKGAEAPSPMAEAWAEFVRLQVEPEAAAAIAEAVAQFGEAARELVGAADLDGFTLGFPVPQMVARLVLASE